MQVITFFSCILHKFTNYNSTLLSTSWNKNKLKIINDHQTKKKKEIFAQFFGNFIPLEIKLQSRLVLLSTDISNRLP